ncbi:hypothetical protein M9434_001802 [Picochlorum sp. BPE23]|nr:hypothetical protein M9434_001802 [Picochlorum sp. BPE23]
MIQQNTRDSRRRLLILGAAGRDFHNFNVLYRDGPSDVDVVGFTATQIPNIDSRKYPSSLAGKLYPEGLPIWKEDDLEEVIQHQRVDQCMLAYSDLEYSKVMEISSRCLSSGAEFVLMPPEKTMVESCKPLIAVCASRTGCGKSQVSRYIINALEKQGKKCVLIRHPMPYGDLAAQAVQRFGTLEDLERHHVTIEEREEYEQHIVKGTVVYAGVDYEAILRQAEQEADVVIFDGGNNDTPFYKPDLWICVCDPHRAGHELQYYPGDLNLRCADVIVINKANTAPSGSIDVIKANIEKVNPTARCYITSSVVSVDDPDVIRGKRVVVVEDGPTLTHGGMKYGAGKVAADAYHAEIVDPRPYLVRSLTKTLEKYSHIEQVIPAMGYFPDQIKDLEESINAVPCEAVIIGTPMDLQKVVHITKPCVTVTYAVDDTEEPFLEEEVMNFISKHVK